MPDSWPERGAPPPPYNDGEVEVEAILDHRHYPCLRNASGTLIGPKPRFLVSWLGYPPEEASWEPHSHLFFNGQILLAASNLFESQFPAAPHLGPCGSPGLGHDCVMYSRTWFIVGFVEYNCNLFVQFC